MRPDRHSRAKPPLDRGGLERIALHYAGRYATTRAKLGAYLARKVRERGWAGDESPDLDALVRRFAELGYVDDRAFASSRAAALQRRGYGTRRIDQALKAAGLDEEDAAPAKEDAESQAWNAALRFAERKRLGPYAAEPLDRDARRRAFAAMVRAGHDLSFVRQVLDARPGEIPNPDNM